MNERMKDTIVASQFSEILRGLIVVALYSWMRIGNPQKAGGGGIPLLNG
jgi:hypothetical protein